VYCNLLQCHHFAETSVIAYTPTDIVGFASAYLVPTQPSTLFVWQVAIDEKVRGKGLALSMLKHLLTRDACTNVTHIHTTITSNNQASWTLFTKLAATLNSTLSDTRLFDRNTHFDGEHDTENLVSIGPFTPLRKSNLQE